MQLLSGASVGTAQEAQEPVRKRGRGAGATAAGGSAAGAAAPAAAVAVVADEAAWKALADAYQRIGEDNLVHVVHSASQFQFCCRTNMTVVVTRS